MTLFVLSNFQVLYDKKIIGKLQYKWTNILDPLWNKPCPSLLRLPSFLTVHKFCRPFCWQRNFERLIFEYLKNILKIHVMEPLYSIEHPLSIAWRYPFYKIDPRYWEKEHWEKKTLLAVCQLCIWWSALSLY